MPGSHHPLQVLANPSTPQVLANPSTLRWSHHPRNTLIRSNHLISQAGSHHPAEVSPTIAARPVFSVKSQASWPFRCFAATQVGAAELSLPRVIVDTGAEEHMGPPAAAEGFTTPTNIVILPTLSIESPYRADWLIPGG